MTQEHALASVHTSNLPDILRQLNCSLVVTTYQAGRVILVRHEEMAQGAGPARTLNTHFRLFDRPMGVCEKDGRLSIGGTNTVWEYRNVPGVTRKLDPPGKHDACYVPRGIHFTGNIDIHEMSWSDDDRLWLVNTRFSCLCTLDDDNSFHPRWRPRFVTAYAPEDRCHLNGLAMRDGRPRYVTALGETDSMGAWRANKADGGILLDVESGEVILRGLSMPHSPRWYRDRLWVLESGKGTLSVVDPRSNVLSTVATLPGFTRGIDFIGPLAFVGLSKVRETASFSGIPIVKDLTERICGVWVVHIESREILGFLRFESGVEEIFAVQILRGTGYPEMLMPDDPMINHTYVLPDEALAEVSMPTPEQLQESPHAWMARGLELFRKHEYAEAVAAFRECLARQPGFPDAHYNLAVALAEAGVFVEALEHLRAVRDREPDRSEVHLSLGSLCQRIGEYDEARRAFEAAISRQPDDALAHSSLGVLLLQHGDYRRGFDEYEWRLKSGQEPALRTPHPDWDGKPAPDKTLLVHAGQDDGRRLILLARYLPQVAAQVRKVILLCPEAYASILATVPGVGEIRKPGEVNVSEFDTQVSLESLPWLLGTTEDNVPPFDAGIDLDALRRRGARSPLLQETDAVKVGLVRVNAGSTTQSAVGVRSSFPPDAVDGLMEFADVVYYDLTPGVVPDVATPRPKNVRALEFLAGNTDPAELALVIAQLDLVVGVDSPAVHLAGALGRPVWVLLGRVSDWYWPAATESSPWYPTARIFRQPISRDRDEWVELIRRAFAAWLEARKDRAVGSDLGAVSR
jgi:uncharacterized protein (TIGR03032 family)